MLGGCSKFFWSCGFLVGILEVRRSELGVSDAKDVIFFRYNYFKGKRCLLILIFLFLVEMVFYKILFIILVYRVFCVCFLVLF